MLLLLRSLLLFLENHPFAEDKQNLMAEETGRLFASAAPTWDTGERKKKECIFNVSYSWILILTGEQSQAV